MVGLVQSCVTTEAEGTPPPPRQYNVNGFSEGWNQRGDPIPKQEKRRTHFLSEMTCVLLLNGLGLTPAYSAAIFL